MVHLGSWVPFGQVPRLLACFAHLTIARETARTQTEAAGGHLVAAAQAAAPALAPPADPGPDSPLRLQVSADGAMVRLQSGEWVEVKTVAVGEVQAQRAADGSLHAQTRTLSYFSRHAPAEDFTRQAVVELHRRGVRRAAAVAGVADGALWVQSFLDYHRLDAVRILDLPHAAEHLGTLAAAVWGPGSPAARTWQQQQIQVLREQGAAPVLAAVGELAAAHVGNEAVAEQAGYLRRRAEQMAYPAFAAAGWPLGSGVVESANKVVVEARLKGAGMGWGAAALNPVLALRNAVCNDRWREAWGVIEQGQQAAQAQRRRGGAAAGAYPPGAARAGQGERPAPVEIVPAALEAEVVAILERVRAAVEQERAGAAVVKGTPGPWHPWRHSRIGKTCQYTAA